MDFTEKEIASVCEAYQFGKQHRQPLPKERNMSNGLLNVVEEILTCSRNEAGPPRSWTKRIYSVSEKVLKIDRWIDRQRWR